MNNHTSNNNRRSFREAVVLNNLAARMLESSSFAPAAETLKDAVSLMRSSVNANHHDSSACPEVKLHNARVRLTESLKQRKAHRTVCIVQVLANDANPLSAHTTTVDRAASSPTTSLIAIKIDNYDRADKDPDAISAILFYNFGLSYYCLSKTMNPGKKPTTTQQSKEAAKYAKGALRLFRISHSLCAKVLQSKVGGIECPELLHVMAIILEALTKFLFESNQVDQAKVFLSLLNQVRYVLKEATLRLGLSDGMAAAAAA
jgi:hypothetical protein